MPPPPPAPDHPAASNCKSLAPTVLHAHPLLDLLLAVLSLEIQIYARFMRCCAEWKGIVSAGASFMKTPRNIPFSLAPAPLRQFDFTRRRSAPQPKLKDINVDIFNRNSFIIPNLLTSDETTGSRTRIHVQNDCYHEQDIIAILRCRTSMRSIYLPRVIHWQGFRPGKRSDMGQ